MNYLDLDQIKEIDEHVDYKIKLYSAALYYINLDYHIIPIRKDEKALPKKIHNITYSDASKELNTIIEWFHPNDGKFAGWNIGIACGKRDGVFVMDIDTREGKNGYKTLEKMGKFPDSFPDGPMQKTISNGEHRLFQWQENAVCTSGKIGEGIDTRGGSSDSCKGHVVVWPSIIDGKSYEWVRGGKVPFIPSWIMDKLGTAWKPNKSYGRGNENVDDIDLEEKVPEEQIERMLSFINIDDIAYDDWVRIGMSVKSQYVGEKGLDLWGKWSQKGARYKKGECSIRWEGFSDLGTIRIGTLFHFAKEGGWAPDDDRKDIHYNKYDELVAEMNKDYAIVSIGGKIRILREKVPMDKLFLHFDLLDKQSFRTLLENERIFIKIKNKLKAVKVADVWLGHEHRRTYPGGMGLYPNRTAPNGVYNTWNGFSVVPKSGKCSLFCDHIKKIICNSDEDHYQWLMDWLADLVQDPANAKGCAVILKGGEGSGKGIFAEIIGELFGPHYKHLIDTDHLTSNFNAHLMDSIMVFADEIVWGGNKKSAGKLRGMVTEKNIIGERKGIDGISCRSMVHIIMASNEEWVIQAALDSRRWFVLSIPPHVIGNMKYFKAMVYELNYEGGREALLYLLLNRKITSNLRLAPQTEALQEQRILNLRQDDMLNWWVQKLIKEELLIPNESEYIDNKSEDGDWPEKVDKMSLYENFDTWRISKGGRSISVFIFQKKVNKLGIISTKIRQKGDIRKSVYKIPSIEQAKRFIITNYGDILND